MSPTTLWADLGWLLWPVLALLAGTAALAPLGTQVLARGVVFIDLALAQLAACGALAVTLIDDHPSAWLAHGAAALAALGGAALVWWLAQRWPAQREALIGLVYVAAAGLAMLAVTWDPHGKERLAALLAADVLWAAPQPTLALVGVAVAVLALGRWRDGVLQRDLAFYPLFAVALSVAVPVLGLYLVFACLIAPALWVRRGWSRHRSSVAAAVVALLGLCLSWWTDWPSGACVAVCLSVAGVGAALMPRGEV